ncbi:MAG: hypothetical protein WD512_14855 [Candidatus Paceibacterota bacterium]
MENLNDLQQERLIQTELEKIGLPQNKLNSLLKMLDNQIKCGPVCQKNQRDENLKRLYDNAVITKEESPYKVKIAEKNYYEATKGTAFYNDMLKDRYSSEIKEIAIKSIKQHKDILDENKLLISNYETQQIYSDKIDKLHKKVTLEYEWLIENVDKYKASVQTNDRKTFYEDQQIENLDKWNKFISYLFWILFIALAINVLLFKKQYTDYKTWITLFLVVFLPLYAMPYLYHSFIKIKDKLTTNDVYVDIK